MNKRAEKAALEAYPDDRFVSAEYSSMCRDFYQEGYEQAEKDLALTWEDVMFISQTVTPCPYTSGLKEICEETLKRFNEQRKK